MRKRKSSSKASITAHKIVALFSLLFISTIQTAIRSDDELHRKHSNAYIFTKIGTSQEEDYGLLYITGKLFQNNRHTVSGLCT